ncbi:fungal-specific transcription factor domain protein [Xylogone sp. PMI_703]|nr:fungal-specific transcription factor domain protein [Xylogone sp. PMI_703]
MASSEVVSAQAPLSRPYRSKRARPCDLCRSRKACCRIYIAPPCGLCRKLGMDCSFLESPSKRQRRQKFCQDNNFPGRYEAGATSPETNNLSSTAATLLPKQDAVYFQLEYLQRGGAVGENMLEEMNMTSQYDGEDGGFSNLMYGGGIDGGPENAELLESALTLADDSHDSLSIPRHGLSINSIDHKRGINAQYFGLSGESDPFLLRHYQYDEKGEFNQFKLSYRKVADDSPLSGLPDSHSSNGVPVYFKISADDLEREMKEETAIRPNVSPEMMRKELYELVKVEDGCRLMDLFLKYVFPSYPAISRSQLGLTPENPTPSPSTLERVPTHLLAAIYASSLHYCPHDDYLCVSNVYSQPSATKIWRIAYEEIFREIHTPHLSLVQAMLLYLQKPRSSVTSDTPFHWSLMGMLIALTTSLALHLDCHDWNIPPWEKRLRRRLWWMVYVEEKWRCLLGGYTSLISSDQWDVSELTEEDFVVDGVNTSDSSTPINNDGHTFESGARFCHLAQLSLISEEVYRSFYTLRSSRLLSNDFDSSLATAQPIHLRLKAWYSSLPASLQIRKRSMLDETRFEELESNSALHFAYLTLEVLLYRALLRPLNVREIPKYANYIDNGARDGNALSDGCGVAWSPPTSAHNGSEGNREAAEAVILAAEKCAKIVTDFTAGLDSQSFSAGFWYSWSRIGFATMSNFAMLLLVKAPDTEHLSAAKQIMQNWRRMLRFQSRSFEQMKLGLLRLEVMLWKGMDNYIMDKRRMEANS